MSAKPTTTDQDVIRSAYEDAVAKMFEVFLDNLIVGGTDSAATHFKLGLAKAREARDFALQLVQEPAK